MIFFLFHHYIIILRLIRDRSKKLHVFDGWELNFRPFWLTVNPIKTLDLYFITENCMPTFSSQRQLEYTKLISGWISLEIEYLKRTKATPQCQVHFGRVEGVVTSLSQTFWMGIGVLFFFCFQK